MQLKHFSMSSVWLHSDRLQQLERSMLCRIRRRSHLEGRTAVFADARLAGVAYDGGEFGKQRAKAVDAVIRL